MATAAFDPAAYLANKPAAPDTPAPAAPSKNKRDAKPADGGGFDPSAYLAAKSAAAPAAATTPKASAAPVAQNRQVPQLNQFGEMDETTFDPITGLPIAGPGTMRGPGPTGTAGKIVRGLETVSSIPVSAALGVTKPFLGAAQIGSRILRKEPTLIDKAIRSVNEAQENIKQRTGDPLYLNTIANFGGEVANPLGRLAIGPTLTKRVAGGTALGLLSPTDPDLVGDAYWNQKAEQAALSGGASAILPPVLNKAINVGVKGVTNLAEDIAASRVGQMVNALRGKQTPAAPGTPGAPGVAAPAQQSTMAGVGSASADRAARVTAEADELPVPITNLTRGQATREPSLQYREDDLVKSYPAEARIIAATKADQQQKLSQNFDYMIDAMQSKGATSYGDYYDTGVSLKTGLTNAADAWKKKYTDKYTLARSEAETRVNNVSMLPVTNFIKGQSETVKRKIAPILKAIDEEIELLSQGRRNKSIPLADTENLIQLINKVTGGVDDASAKFGRELKALIDQQTEGKGGKLFKEARALRREYSERFDDSETISKLLGTRAGHKLTDAVSAEGAFDVVMRASRQDVEKLLKELGDAGQTEAIANLKQQFIADLKNRLTRGAARDLNGNPIFSPAQFNSEMQKLERSGKLDLLLGDEAITAVRRIGNQNQTVNVGNANQIIRNLRNVVDTVNNPVPGHNVSGTAAGHVRGASLLNYIPGFGKPLAEALRSSKAREQAKEAVFYSPQELAKQLRKIERQEREDVDYLKMLRGG